MITMMITIMDASGDDSLDWWNDELYLIYVNKEHTTLIWWSYLYVCSMCSMV